MLDDREPSSCSVVFLPSLCLTLLLIKMLVSVTWNDSRTPSLSTEHSSNTALPPPQLCCVAYREQQWQVCVVCLVADLSCCCCTWATVNILLFKSKMGCVLRPLWDGVQQASVTLIGLPPSGLNPFLTYPSNCLILTTLFSFASTLFWASWLLWAISVLAIVLKETILKGGLQLYSLSLSAPGLDYRLWTRI